MSPEQAAGDIDRLGPRSDVYSLGATLYCLLTGKAPFDGDVGEVLRKVQEGDFTTPRQHDGALDRALEAVCLKAMATRPEVRYATAKALAEDVERWAADEPVSAWREPLARRARRWGRRNRTAVTAGAVAVLALLFGTAAVLAVQTEANSVLKRSNLALADANARVTKANANLSQANTALAAAKDREAARFNLAMEAIKLFHGEVGDDLVLKEDQFKPLRDKLLKAAADFYGKLEGLLKDQPDQASRRAMGNAYFELGELTEKIGDQPAALAAHHKGLAIRRALASATTTDAEARGEVAESLLAIGWLRFQMSNLADALARSEEARDLLESQPLPGPGSDGHRSVLGRAYNMIGNAFETAGKTAAAISAYERSVEIHARLVDANPDVTLFRERLASSYHNLGIAQMKTGQPAKAMELFRRALTIQQKLVDDNPAVTLFRQQLSYEHYHVGVLQSETGEPAEALESFRSGLTIQQKLVDDNPAVTLFREQLANSHHAIGGLQSQTGHPAEAMKSYQRMLAITQKLVEDNPTVAEFRLLLSMSHAALGNLQAEAGHPAEALESYLRALTIQQKLVDDSPDVAKFRVWLSRTHSDIGWLQAQTGHPSEALESYRRALSIEQKLVDGNPNIPEFRSQLSSEHNRIGLLQKQTGHPAQAMKSYRSALAIRQKLVDDNPTVTGFRRGLWQSHNNIGGLLTDTGDPAAAMESYRRALAITQKLADDNPTVIDYQRTLAEGLLVIGWHLAQAGQNDEAIAYYSREEAIRRKLADATSASVDSNWLANCQTNTADLLRKAGRRDEARAACERAIALREPLVKNHPQVTLYRGGLAETYLRAGQVRFDAGDPAGAASAWRRAISLYDGLKSPDGEQTIFRACCHAGLSALAGRPDSGVSAAEGLAESDRAMTWLRRAVAAGQRNPDTYRTESALDPLRNRPDFRLLMMDLAMPADPFAPGD
jgi:tetratricopeptide (TPR) repeat protein